MVGCRKNGLHPTGYMYLHTQAATREDASALAAEYMIGITDAEKHEETVDIVFEDL